MRWDGWYARIRGAARMPSRVRDLGAAGGVRGVGPGAAASGTFGTRILGFCSCIAAGCGWIGSRDVCRAAAVQINARTVCTARFSLADPSNG